HDGGVFNLVMDLGNGALGTLQKHIGLHEVDAVALSHLHADHCLDMCGMYVYRKYHPDGELRRIDVYGPRDTPGRLARAYDLAAVPGMSGQFDFHTWDSPTTTRIGPFHLTPTRVVHPVEAYALRVECGGRTLTYSGDTGPTPALTDAARNADVFLCEASFVESEDNPPGLHMTGADAAAVAASAGVGRLLLTHIPAWHDRAEVEQDAKSVYDGRLELVVAGATYQV